MTQQLDVDALWAAVDRLLTGRRVKLLRDDGTKDWADVPSLWAQVESATATGSEQSGRAAAGSRPPVDFDLLAFRADVTDVVVDALRGHDQKPRLCLQDGRGAVKLDGPVFRQGGDRPGGFRTVDLPGSLRLLAGTIIGLGDIDLLDWWIYRVRSWSRQAERHLGLSDEPSPRRIRGVACPECRATHVTVQGDDGPQRVPCLIIDFNGPYVRAAQCDVCGATWWRGDDLHRLAEALDTPGDVALADPA